MKLIVAAALCLSIASVGSSQSPPRFPDSPKKQRLGPLADKVDARLLPELYDVAAKRSGKEATASKIRGRLLDGTLPASSADAFIVRISCDASAAMVDAISKTGARVISATPKWKTVTAEADLVQIEALSAVPGVDFVKLESGAAAATSGAADNHADIDMKADLLRSGSALNGSGQKIGVLSDTCNRTGAVGAGSVAGSVPNATLTGTNNQISGDLPASCQVVDFGPGTGTDEGAGMMELIYDICPSSQLAFASAFNGQASFASNIGLLRTAASSTVICDDVFYFEEPFFQDGPIAQAVDACVDNGVPYFAIAGNHYNGGIQARFVDSNPANGGTEIPPNGLDFHDWGIGGATPTFLPITIANNTTLRVTLQWNQPWSSFGLGSGSQSDFDLHLYTGPGVGFANVANATDLQGTSGAPSGDATEFLSYQNTSGATQTYYLAADHFHGVSNNVLRLVFLSNGATYLFPSGGADASTIYGHMAAAKAITVGAIFYGDIESNGTQGPDFSNINGETFTSKGGRGASGIPIYFTTSGSLIPGGPELRDKPDVAAPDGTNTRFFGFDSAFDVDSFPNFFGTSAATPNAAAVGALLRQKTPSLTPSQLKALLKLTARDIVAAAPLSVVGADDIAGFGLIDAQAAGGITGFAPLQVSRMKTSLKFTASSGDSLAVSGLLNVPAGFAPLGKTVSIDAGGVHRVLTLDEKGSAKTATDSFRVKIKATGGVVEAQTSPFTAAIKKSSLATLLYDEGLRNENATAKPVEIDVTIAFAGKIYGATVPQLYTAKAGKTGKTK